MEFRDKLLSSEIRHVTEVVNMLSYELVILQDFLKEEFGMRYSRFRRRHALASDSALQGSVGPRVQSQPARQRHNNVTSAVSATGDSKIAIKVISTTSSNNDSQTRRQSNTAAEHSLDTPEASSAAAETENPLEDEHSSFMDDNVEEVTMTMPTKVDMEHISPEFEDDDYRMDEDNDNESVSSSDNNSNGTPIKTGGRLHIWRKFNIRLRPDGKKVVSCRKCRSSVSAVPKRMEKHYKKCCLNIPDPDPAPVTSAARKTHLPKGTVWVHFNQETDSDGKTLVMCKYCCRKVSNHATRMARHLQKCDLSPVYGASDDSSLFETKTDSVDRETGDTSMDSSGLPLIPL